MIKSVKFAESDKRLGVVNEVREYWCFVDCYDSGLIEILDASTGGLLAWRICGCHVGYVASYNFYGVDNKFIPVEDVMPPF